MIGYRLLKFLFLLLLAFPAGQIAAQAQINWDVLADVQFEATYSSELGVELTSATFGPWPKAFEGKEVSITGYVLPLDPMGLSYVLSRNPNASCFFCGGAGPESILGLNFKPGAMQRYKTDQRVTFLGTLQLNKLDDDQFTYMLLDAVEQ